MNKSVRVCIDARILPGASGGLEQVVIGLAKGFSCLDDGNEKYFFLTYSGYEEWLSPYIAGPSEILRAKGPTLSKSAKDILASKFLIAKQLVRTLIPLSEWMITVPRTDGTIESAGIDLMHFSRQDAFLTDLPSIYHPHDLQHAHLPEFFSRLERLSRDVLYRSFCDKAAMVAVGSSWTRDDVITQFELAREKVRVIPLAPSTEAYPIPKNEDLVNTAQKFCLPSDFLFYPAQTWKHKNHISLIEAAAQLRKIKGLKIPLVFSGKTNDFYPEIQKNVKQLGLTDQIQFLGFVSTLELQCLYRLCRCVVIPTKFEAASFPLWEAFHAGVPAACSNVTSLPEQAGDAALVFDPEDTSSIAHSVQRLWEDEKLRYLLSKKGKENVSRFSWERTARSFRAHYRRILCSPLTTEDRTILEAKPII